MITCPSVCELTYHVVVSSSPIPSHATTDESEFADTSVILAVEGAISSVKTTLVAVLGIFALNSFPVCKKTYLADHFASRVTFSVPKTLEEVINVSVPLIYQPLKE